VSRVTKEEEREQEETVAAKEVMEDSRPLLPPWMTILKLSPTRREYQRSKEAPLSITTSPLRPSKPAEVVVSESPG